jgi:hypothetical protein
MYIVFSNVVKVGNYKHGYDAKLLILKDDSFLGRLTTLKLRSRIILEVKQ